MFPVTWPWTKIICMKWNKNAQNNHKFTSSFGFSIAECRLLWLLFYPLVGWIEIFCISIVNKNATCSIFKPYIGGIAAYVTFDRRASFYSISIGFICKNLQIMWSKKLLNLLITFRTQCNPWIYIAEHKKKIAWLKIRNLDYKKKEKQKIYNRAIYDMILSQTRSVFIVPICLSLKLDHMQCSSL